MPDAFDSAVRARIEKYRKTDPARAEELEKAYRRLQEAEARLEKLCENDERDLLLLSRFTTLRGRID